MCFPLWELAKEQDKNETIGKWMHTCECWCRSSSLCSYVVDRSVISHPLPLPINSCPWNLFSNGIKDLKNECFVHHVKEIKKKEKKGCCFRSSVDFIINARKVPIKNVLNALLILFGAIEELSITIITLNLLAKFQWEISAGLDAHRNGNCLSSSVVCTTMVSFYVWHKTCTFTSSRRRIKEAAVNIQPAVTLDDVFHIWSW